MAPVSTAGGGEGGGANNNNTPAPLTMEAVTGEINKILGTRLSTEFEKFKKEGLGEAIKAHLDPINTSLSGLADLLKNQHQNPDPNNPNPAGGNKGPDPQTNVLLKELQDRTKAQGDQIQRLQREKQEADERAERSERHGTIRQALTNLHFVTDSAAKTAFQLVEPNVKRLDDGTLIGTVNGADFPLDAFVKDYLSKEHPYLLKASGISGSGAGSGTGGVRMGVKADVNDIKTGMKPETRESVVASIAAALQS